ncbi:hypothetical protein [Nannocystis pusilla]|uniref:hypothetical protein n=1 Tax=Nannocystis pusilla TaxID=889268 RepID=UPI003B7C0251
MTTSTSSSGSPASRPSSSSGATRTCGRPSALRVIVARKPRWSTCSPANGASTASPSARCVIVRW